MLEFSVTSIMPNWDVVELEFLAVEVELLDPEGVGGVEPG